MSPLGLKDCLAICNEKGNIRAQAGEGRRPPEALHKKASVPRGPGQLQEGSLEDSLKAAGREAPVLEKKESIRDAVYQPRKAFFCPLYNGFFP